MAPVFVVPCKSLVRAGSWRQVGCSVADRLDAGFFVVRDDCDLGSGCIALLQDSDLAVDAEHLGHLRLEGLVTTFEIVADLMRPDLLSGEYLADRALDDAGQGGMSGRGRVLAGVTGQQPRGPQFVWVSQVLGFLAGQRHQPGLGLRRDVRRLAGARAVIERRHHAKARRTAQATLHGLVGHPDPRAHRRRRGFRAIGQKDARPLHPACRFRPRPRQRLQPRQVARIDHELNHSPRCCHELQPSC